MKKCLLFLLFTPYIYSQFFNLKIEGANNSENLVIDSLSFEKKFENLSLLQKETELFVKKITNVGYFNNNFNLLKTNDSVFTYKGNLGMKTDFLILSFEKIEPDVLKLFNIKLKLKTNEVENYLNNILLNITEKGFLEAKVFLSNFETNKNYITCKINVDLKNNRKINNIVFNGYTDFPKTIKKQITRKYFNKILNTRNLNLIDDEIKTLPFVKIIKPAEALLKKDSTEVYVYTEKRKNNSFDGYIGFGNNKTNNKLKLNGYADINLLNNLNSGEQLNIYWKNDGNEQSTFNISTQLAYVFKSPVAVKANLNIIKKDSTFQNTTTNLYLGYHFNFNSKVFVGIKQSSSEAIQNNTTTIADLNSEFYTLSYNNKQFDFENKLFPEKLTLDIEIGNGNRKTKLTKSSQQIFALKASYLFKINAKNYFNTKTENFYLKSNDFYTNELYRFGGINSMRGFVENSLQANFISSLQNEYRYVPSENLYTYFLTDIGYYEDKTTNTKNKLYSIGLGIGVLNNYGVLNLVYANGSNNFNSLNLSNSIFQINFKTVF